MTRLMSSERFDGGNRARLRMAGLSLVLLALLAGCAAAAPEVAGNGDAATPSAAPSTATPPAEGWAALLTRQPFPYLLPLMDDEPTPLDGTYVKLEPSRGDPAHCLRCPDYAQEAGLWKMHLHRGVFRIYYEGREWSSVGSFLVTRDRMSKVEDPDKLLLFNDPNCTDVMGVYRWEKTEEGLRLEVVDDTCSYRLRAANLTSLPWLSCAPPSEEAAITDHWPKPEGCD
jgi:hypothetical protein